jgi:hypothetical protein
VAAVQTVSLEELYQFYRVRPHSDCILNLENAQRLYELILEHQPRLAIDLGTGLGFSAAVMASAMQVIGSGNIISIENDLAYQRQAVRHLPGSLRPYVRFHHRGLAPHQHLGEPWQCYSGVEESTPNPIDFVLLDGSPQSYGRLNSSTSATDVYFTPTCDIMHLQHGLRNGALVFIYGRVATVNALYKALDPRFTWVRRAKVTDDYSLLRWDEDND